MPHYDYVCNDCNYTVEVYQSFTDEKLKICPKCKKENFERLIGCGISFFVKQDPKTVGHLAERNTKKFGKDECYEREMKAKEKLVLARRARGLKHKEKADTPWWRDGSMPNLIKSDKPLDEPQTKKVIDELKSEGVHFKENALPPKRKKNGK